VVAAAAVLGNSVANDNDDDDDDDKDALTC